jgi:hypothetical protein
MPGAQPAPKTRKELYEQIARGGKDEVIYEEMVRLGFWGGDKPRPTDPPDEIKRALDLRKRLNDLRESAARMRNLARLELELKKKRLAESKKKREQTKQRRLGERAVAKAQTQETKKYELRYVGAQVSVGLGPTTGRRQSDAARLSAAKLPVIHDAAELARSMGVYVGELRFLSYAREVSTTPRQAHVVTLNCENHANGSSSPRGARMRPSRVGKRSMPSSPHSPR